MDVGRGALRVRVGLTSTKLGKSSSSTRGAWARREGVPTGCTTMAVDDGVMGTTRMAVEDAAFEDVGMNVILDTGTVGGVDSVNVVRPSSGLPE
jgi:hypothetical protein